MSCWRRTRYMMHPSTISITTLILATLYAGCSTEESSEHHNNKRAPLGFTGVRGKKSIPDSAYTETDDSGNLVARSPLNEVSGSAAVEGGSAIIKRAPSGFMGMRGKKPYPFASVWEGTYPDTQYKRAPSGFVGMRGKKDQEFSNYYVDDFYKRAPSGFMGMRGKKDIDDYEPDFYDKRAPSMGFVGMRGKKEIDDLDLLNDKRAPQTGAGFFGMRGKKQSRQSGFFGMRGKKYPYDIRGKFVGVRGKKLSNDLYAPEYLRNSMEEDYLAHLGQELDINQLMLLLTANEIDNNGAINYEHANGLNQQQ